MIKNYNYANKKKGKQSQSKREGRRKMMQQQQLLLKAQQKTTGLDPMTKVVINETVNEGNGAQNPDDVLAFSRSIHKIDSSLQ